MSMHEDLRAVITSIFRAFCGKGFEREANKGKYIRNNCQIDQLSGLLVVSS